MPSDATIGEVLARHARERPDAAAIVCDTLGTLSFGALQRRLADLQARLRAAGLGAGARIGIVLPRSPDAALVNIAVCTFATVVPFNAGLPAAELAEEARRTRPHALVLDEDTVPEALPGWIAAAGDGVALLRLRRAAAAFDEIDLEVVRALPAPQPAGAVTDRSWAAIFRTSGTTGPSKRVPVTHQNLVEMGRKMERWLAVGPDDRSACIMPIHYNAGFKATLLVPLLVGCSVAFPASTGAHDVETWIDRLRPTWLTASPAFLQAVCDRLRERPPGEVGRRLRFVLSTASYLPESVRTEAQRLLARPVLEFYGLCEAGMMTGPLLPPATAPAGSVGRVPEGELAIVDERGRPARPGQAGAVLLRGPSVMPGYLVGDIEGAPSGLQDGWLATGDVGSIDADGNLTIVGRTKEIINRGGEKIAPYDVERALLAHPAVREAAAFAVPHPRLGENVGAAVVLRPGASAGATELIDFVYDRLAPFQRPRHVHVVDSLPLGATGKVSRPALAAALADRRDASPPPAAPLEILVGEIWQRLLKRADIGVDDDFFEIGGDSLQATEMLLEVEEITRHRINHSDVRAQLTIRVLCDRLANAAATRREVLTQVRAGSGTPLFLCHGDFCGWGFYGFRLGELMKIDGPVYLLHSLLDHEPGVETIEDMAARYVEEVRRVAPAGPVRIAGYCHGGLAALDLARRLEAAGRLVDKVVLIDTFSLNARPLLRRLAGAVGVAGALVPGRWGARLRRSGMPSVWVLASHLLRRDPAILRRVTKTAASGTMRAWDDSRRTVYYRAMSKYRPRRLRAELVCLLSEEYADRPEYAAAPWRRVSPAVQAGNLPGEHNTCVSRHVDVLAGRFDQAFAPQAAPRPARPAA